MKRGSSSNESSYSDDTRRQLFKYDGKDKSSWNIFLAERDISMNQEKIAYLDDDELINERLVEPDGPEYIPYVQGYGMPAEEPRAMKEERAFRQRRVEKDYDTAHAEWRKVKEDIMRDYGLAVLVLYKHVSESIKNALQTVYNNAKLLNQNAREKYQAVYEYLVKIYGPFAQKDAIDILKTMGNMDLDALGARNAIRLFMDARLILASMPKRNADGEVIRDPAPMDMTRLPPRPPAGGPILQIAEYHNAYALEEAAAQLRQGPPQTHAPTDEEVKQFLLDMLQRSNLEHFRALWLESLKPENFNRTYQDYILRMETLVNNSSKGIDVGGPSNKQAKTRFINMVRDVPVLEEPLPSPKPDRHKRGRSVDSNVSGHGSDGRPFICHNCGRNHLVRNCTSTKCGKCGGRFESIEDRCEHYAKWHMKKSRKDYGSSKYSSSRQRSPSPYPRKSSGGYNSDNSRNSSRSNHSARSDASPHGKYATNHSSNRHHSSKHRSEQKTKYSYPKHKSGKVRKQYVVKQLTGSDDEEDDQASQGSDNQK